MEYLPVEVVGHILSRLQAARDVVIASATCQKWREARRKNLRALDFDCNDWNRYRYLPIRELEILITRTIFQTNGLQSLSLNMDRNGDKFSAAVVIAWLMYTGETLRELHYALRTDLHINILEICGWQELEVLQLGSSTITWVYPSYQKFPCLRSLSLLCVSISALDLSLLITACPKIEVLTLVRLVNFMSNPQGPVNFMSYPQGPVNVLSNPQVTLKLSSNTLKDINVDGISLGKFILEANSLEKLHLEKCTFDVFEIVGKGRLRHLKIEDVRVNNLYFHESAENLEVVDVSKFTIKWTEFYHMISRSSKLRTIRLWGVMCDIGGVVVDLNTISAWFPSLSHLYLKYDLKEMALQYGFQGSFVFENVVVLELGWVGVSDLFLEWVSDLLERCPRLRKLVIYRILFHLHEYDYAECRRLADFTTSIVRLMRKYLHVEFQLIVNDDQIPR